MPTTHKLDNWISKRIIDIAPLQRGFDLPNRDLRSGVYPVVYSNGVGNYHEEYRSKGPGIVTGRSGTIGKVIFIEENYWPHNTALWVTNFKQNDPKFIYYLFLMIGLDRFATGSGVPTLNRNDVHDYEVIIPILKAEQTAIATALSDTDALITSLEKLIVKKRNIKQGAMRELFSPQKGWKKNKLGELGKVYGGLSGKTKEDFQNGSFRYIPFMNIMSNAIIDKGDLGLVNIGVSEKQNTALNGDLFFNGSSETPEEVGMCSVLVDEMPDLYLNSFCFGFRLRRDLRNDPLYLAYFFRSPGGRKLFYSSAQGATRYNLSKSNFLSLEIQLPSHEIQKSTAIILRNMEDEILAIEIKLSKLKMIKAGMMENLLTGKIRLI